VTTVTFGWWRESGDPPPVAEFIPARDTTRDALADFVPVRVTTRDAEVLLAPGESAELPGGEAWATAEIPGCESLGRRFTIPPDRPYLLEFDAADLLPDRSAQQELPESEPLPDPKTIAVKLRPWAPAPSTQLPATTDLLLTKNAEGLAISRTSGSAQPVGVQLATRRTPRRLLAIPPVADSESSQVAWYLPPASIPRPRVEPTDAGGRLLMDYLLAGRYALAATAARAVAAHRGAQQCLDWSAPSYTQLLIGYAYALGGDCKRLVAWCRRTAAAQTLGTDGLVLEAEAAWQQGDVQQCRDLLVRAAGSPPPTVACGAEMGYRRATLLSVVSSGPEPAAQGDQDSAATAEITRPKTSDSPNSTSDELLTIRTDWLRVLIRSDSEAATISVPETGTRSPDLAAASAFRRFRGVIIYNLSKLRYDRVLHRGDTADFRHVIAQKGAVTMAVQEAAGQAPAAGAEAGGEAGGPAPAAAKGQSSLSRPAIVAAFIAVLAWLGFSIYLVTQSGASDLQWTRIAWVFGSIQSIAFAAAGALFGTTIQQNQVKQADERAQKADQAADKNQDEAVKGRALAASIQADAVAAQATAPGGLKPMGPGQPAAQEDVRQKHAQLSKSLFGNLVE
jgi:hypothetical protein